MIRVIHFQLTDEQWANVCRFILLPSEARIGLDNTASMYLMFEETRKEQGRNSATKRGLEQISDTAEKLSRLLKENLSDYAVSMLLDSTRLGNLAGPMHMAEGQRRLNQHVVAVSTLEKWCRDVAEWMPNQAPGRDTSNLNWLANKAAQLFEFHTGMCFADQPGRRKYVSDFVKAVDPGAKEGSIDSAIDAITTDRK